MKSIVCIPLTKFEDLAIESIFHITILMIILTLFFFGVVKNIEINSIKNELIKNIQDGLKNIKMDKNEITSENLKKMAQLYNHPDQDTITYNNSLFNICVIFIAFFIVIFITLLLTLNISAQKCTNIGYVIIENIIVFLCIGIVEYLFFINIAIKYIPIIPSYIQQIVYDNL